MTYRKGLIDDNRILEWQCQRCNAIYAEYVNGCPKCWNRGEVLSGVRLQRPVELRAVALAGRAG